MLHSVRNISCQEEGVSIGQVVVDAIPLWDRAVRADGVQIVVSGADTQIRFQQTSRHKHQRRRDDQLTRTRCNQKAALIYISCDLDYCVFQRCLVQVNICGRTVCVIATSYSRVSRAEQGYAISRVEGGEAIVQQCCCLDLLGIRHGPCESLGVTSRKSIVQVVFHGLLGHGETHCNRFVVVTSSVRLLRGIEADSRTFRLNWRCAKAR